MSADFNEWAKFLRPLHAHQAAETIRADIVAHPGVDFRGARGGPRCLRPEQCWQRLRTRRSLCLLGPPEGDYPHRQLFTVFAVKVDKLNVTADTSAVVVCSSAFQYVCKGGDYGIV